jgi:hypothetical protein
LASPRRATLAAPPEPGGSSSPRRPHTAIDSKEEGLPSPVRGHGRWSASATWTFSRAPWSGAHRPERCAATAAAAHRGREGRKNRCPATGRSCCSGRGRASRWLPGACASGC